MIRAFAERPPTHSRCFVAGGNVLQVNVASSLILGAGRYERLSIASEAREQFVYRYPEPVR